MNIPKRPTSLNSRKLTRSEWEKTKAAHGVDAHRKANKIKAKHDIGPTLDALQKAYEGLFVKNWNELPVDQKDPKWNEKAKSFIKIRLKYIDPFVELIKKLENALTKESEEVNISEFKNDIESKFKDPLFTLRTDTEDFYKELKNECEKQLFATSSPEEGILATRSYNFSRSLAEKLKGSPFSYTCKPIEVSFSIIDLGGKENVFVTQIVTNNLAQVVENSLEEATKLFKNAKNALTREAPKLKTEKMKNDFIKKLQEKLQKLTDDIVGNLKLKLEEEVKTSFQRIAKIKSEYKAYKSAAKIKVFKGSLSVVTATIGTIGSAGAVAGGATTFAGIAALTVSCRSLLKSIAELGITLRTLALDATSMGKRVQNNIKKLADGFSQDPKKNAYCDFGRGIGNAVFDFTISIPCLNTISSIREDFETWRQKTNGLFEGTRKAAKPILSHVIAAQGLQKVINDKLETNGDKKLEKIKQDTIRELANLEETLNNLLIKVTDMGGEFSQNIHELEVCGKQIEKLQKIKDLTVPKIWEDLVKAIKLGADIIDGAVGVVLGNTKVFPDTKIIPNLMGYITDGVDGLNTLHSHYQSIKEQTS